MIAYKLLSLHTAAVVAVGDSALVYLYGIARRCNAILGDAVRVVDGGRMLDVAQCTYTVVCWFLLHGICLRLI